MSLILDALNRSRQDQQAFPDIASQHYVESGNPRGALLSWLPWLALVLALIAVAWLVWERNSPAAVAPEPVVREMPQVSVTEPLPTPLPSVTPAPQPERVIAPAPVAVPATVATPASTPEPAGPDSQPLPAIASPVDPGVAALYQQAPAAAAEAPGQVSANPRARTAVEEQPVDIEKLVEDVRQEMGKSELVDHEVPMIAALSQQTKDRVPTIFYQQHDYSGKRGSSTVTLNGKALRVGETANGGLKVVEILPDSVVLDFQGTRFRLRAMNSWVNL